MKKQTCKNCKWFHGNEKEKCDETITEGWGEWIRDMGACRRYPPKTRIVNFNLTIHKDNCCGEYKQRK